MKMECSSANSSRSRDIHDFVILKKATSLDCEDIGQLLSSVPEEGYVEAIPLCPSSVECLVVCGATNLTQHYEILILELGYRIIGAALVFKPGALGRSDALDASEVGFLAIDPDFQGLGFSARFLEAFERMASSWNSRSLKLQVGRDSTLVAKYCQSRGYIVESGEPPRGGFKTFSLCLNESM